MKSRRTILKQAIACTLPSIPALSATSNATIQIEPYLDEEREAYYMARNLCWSKETEKTWLQFLGTGLKSLNTDVPHSDLKMEISEWCEKIVTSLDERSYFGIENSTFEHKKPMVTNLAGAIRQEKAAEEKVIHCIDLLRLISPIHHFQEDDSLDRNEPIPATSQLTRLKRYYPEVFEQLAQATVSLELVRLEKALDEWSNQLEEEKKQEALLQMNEGLSLLRGEAITA
jgi:hypothetical protein